MRRSPHDREILRLAALALPALAAEPLYLLVDTAIVGHLGTPELAALALAATVLGSVVALCNFLTYGTTAQVARLHGAGQAERAGEMAAQALWLSLAVGAVAGAACAVLADPLMRGLGGGESEITEMAARYLRISAIGIPFALIALGGQGYLRGVDDLRTPLVVVVASNGVNVVLEVLFVYGFGWGLDGSAAGTVIAQLGMGGAFAWLLLRAPARSRRPHLALLARLSRMGGHIALRTGSLLAAFALASAVLARIGADSLAAHQIAYQLFLFGALTLDAIAIAGQIMVGRALGGGDASLAWDASRRMCSLALLAGLALGALMAALAGVLPGAFTGDGEVVDRAGEMWPLFVVMWPVGALVFALDGILIGAGDTRYLAVAMVASSAVFAALTLVALSADWGIEGVWWALNAFMAARLATTGLRFLSRRWAIVGATT